MVSSPFNPLPILAHKQKQSVIKDLKKKKLYQQMAKFTKEKEDSKY